MPYAHFSNAESSFFLVCVCVRTTLTYLPKLIKKANSVLLSLFCHSPSVSIDNWARVNPIGFLVFTRCHLHFDYRISKVVVGLWTRLVMIELNFELGFFFNAVIVLPELWEKLRFILCFFLLPNVNWWITHDSLYWKFCINFEINLNLGDPGVKYGMVQYLTFRKMF